jgi:putative transposase
MGVMPSVGSVGDAYDNAMAESFFATLECELLDRCSFRTPAEAKLAVFEYLEGFYNPRRRHSSIGYRSPVQFEHEFSGEPKPQRMHGAAGRGIDGATSWN